MARKFFTLVWINMYKCSRLKSWLLPRISLYSINNRKACTHQRLRCSFISIRYYGCCTLNGKIEPPSRFSNSIKFHQVEYIRTDDLPKLLLFYHKQPKLDDSKQEENGRIKGHV